LSDWQIIPENDRFTTIYFAPGSSFRNTTPIWLGSGEIMHALKDVKTIVVVIAL
jgi:hypothetical protein